MEALCWYGKEDVQVEIVADPEIVNATDAIVKIIATAICGSDLHLYDGLMPTIEKGDIFGHEPMGEVVEVGSEVKKSSQLLCDKSNPTAPMARMAMGQSPAGFGYSHMLDGYPGRQAEYLRVPFVDVGPILDSNPPRACGFIVLRSVRTP